MTHGNEGNQHAKKPARAVKDAAITIRCRGADLRRWQRAARKAGQKPQEWAIEQLNKAERNEI